MNNEFKLIDSINWLDASQKTKAHPGTWNFEYHESRNRVTRVYSHSCTMAFIDGNILKLIVMSEGETPTSNCRLMSLNMLDDNMAHILIDAEDVVLNITTNIPDVSDELLSRITSIKLIELVINDLTSIHQQFALWAIQYLPTEHIQSESDLLLQLDLLLSLEESTYIAGIVNTSRDVLAIMNGGLNPVTGIQKSIVKYIQLH